MTARPFMLLGASVLRAVQATFDGAVRKWAREWGLADTASAVSCARAADLAAVQGAAWRQRRTAGAGGLWLAWPDRIAADIGCALFAPDGGPAPATPLAAAAADSAFAQLLDALAAAAFDATPGVQDASGDGPDPALFGHGAGALAVRLEIGDQSVHCLLDPACVGAMTARAARSTMPAPDLAPLDYWNVVRDVPVTLPVRIGAAQVGMGSLLAIAAGDVIRLDSCVDDTVALAAPDGVALFSAYLGQVRGSVAVEVINRT